MIKRKNEVILESSLLSPLKCNRNPACNARWWEKALFLGVLFSWGPKACEITCFPAIAPNAAITLQERLATNKAFTMRSSWGKWGVGSPGDSVRRFSVMATRAVTTAEKRPAW